jgi:hypothetical protein
VPIDATATRVEPRPLRGLQVMQTLDERQADKGKLILEIKATGRGLIGHLSETLDIAPEGFDVAQVNDQGLSIAKFDEDGEANAIVSERIWLVELRAKPGLAVAPRTFRFGAARVDGAEMAYHRYQDADLVAVGQEVSLEHDYKGRGAAWVWVAGAAGAALVVIGLLMVIRLLRRRPHKAPGPSLPDRLTPFTVAALLHRIRQAGALTPEDGATLDREIAALEQRFFAAGTDHSDGDVHLRTVAETWVRRGSAGTNGRHRA